MIGIVKKNDNYIENTFSLLKQRNKKNIFFAKTNNNRTF